MFTADKVPFSAEAKETKSKQLLMINRETIIFMQKVFFSYFLSVAFDLVRYAPWLS